MCACVCGKCYSKCFCVFGFGGDYWNVGSVVTCFTEQTEL